MEIIIGWSEDTHKLLDAGCWFSALIDKDDMRRGAG